MSDWTADLRSLARGASKDVQDVLEAALQAGGWVGRRTAKGHIALRHKSGGTAVVPSTPSDSRAVRNARRDIEKGGSSE